MKRPVSVRRTPVLLSLGCLLALALSPARLGAQTSTNAPGVVWWAYVQIERDTRCVRLLELPGNGYTVLFVESGGAGNVPPNSLWVATAFPQSPTNNWSRNLTEIFSHDPGTTCLALDMAVTPNGELAVLVQLGSVDTNEANDVLVKLDAEGRILSVSAPFFNNHEPETPFVWELHATADSGFLAIGYGGSPCGPPPLTPCPPGVQYSYAGVTKLDASGSPGAPSYYTYQDQETTNGANSFAYSASPTADGGFVLAGYTALRGVNPYGGGIIDTDPGVYVIKVDSSGARLWETRTTNSFQVPYGRHITQASDGGYLVSASGPNITYRHSVVVKLDANGYFEWEKELGLQGIDTVVGTRDHGFLLSGYHYYGGSPKNWLLKLNSRGEEFWRLVLPATSHGAFFADDDCLAIESSRGTYVAAYVTQESLGDRVHLIELGEDRLVQVDVRTRWQEKGRSLDVLATARCAVDGVLTPANTRSATCRLKDYQGTTIGQALSLTFNPASEQWEALGIDVADLDPVLCSVSVTLVDLAGDAGLGVGRIWEAVLKVSSPSYLQPQGSRPRLFAQVRSRDSQADTGGQRVVKCRVPGAAEDLALNDSAVLDDFTAHDGIYSGSCHLTGDQPATLRLLLDGAEMDSAIVEPLGQPFLAVITDFRRLYREFQEMGMTAEDDLNANGQPDFFDLLGRLHRYAAEHAGIVADAGLELTVTNGYSADYGSLDYSDLAQRVQMGWLVDEFLARIPAQDPTRDDLTVAIFGDDEVVPFTRKLDDSDNGEHNYPGALEGVSSATVLGNPTLYDSASGLVMTDVPYGTLAPANGRSDDRPRVARAVGRLFARAPSTLAHLIDVHDQPLDVTSNTLSAAVFVAPDEDVTWGQLVSDALLPALRSRLGPGALTNLPPGRAGEFYLFDANTRPWSATEAVRVASGVDLSLFWSHAEMRRQQPGAPSPTLRESGIFANTVRSGPEAAAGLWISTGCHAGYSISHESENGDFAPYEDQLTLAILEKGWGYVAPSVYGLCINGKVAYHDRLMQGFLTALLDPNLGTVGDAWLSAYHAYDRSWSTNVLDLSNRYAAYGTVFYGLPTRPLRHSAAGPLRPARADARPRRLRPMGPVTEYPLEFTIDVPRLSVVPNGAHVEIEVPGSRGTLVEAGAPMLPLIVREYTLPPDAIIHELNLVEAQTEIYPQALAVLPAVPVNKTHGPHYVEVQLPIVYPAANTWWSVERRGETRVLSVMVVPVRLDRSTGEATFYRRLRFSGKVAFDAPAYAIADVTVNQGNPISTAMPDVPVTIGLTGMASAGSVLSWTLRDGSGVLCGSGQDVAWTEPANACGFSFGTEGMTAGEKALALVISDGTNVVTTNLTVLVSGVHYEARFEKARYPVGPGGATIWFDPRDERGEPVSDLQVSNVVVTLDGAAATFELERQDSPAGYRVTIPIDGLAAGDHAAAFTAQTSSGEVLTWEGTLAVAEPPVVVTPQFALGVFHSVAVRDTGELFVWGANGGGQLGNPAWTFQNHPTRLDSIADVEQVTAAGDYTIGVKVDGTVWGWGYNGDGQLCLAANPEIVSVPTRLPALEDQGRMVALPANVAIIRPDGHLWLTGASRYGLLGAGDPPPATNGPVEIAALTNVSDVAGKHDFIAVLTAEGSVYTWGSCMAGRLGNGVDSSEIVTEPTRVDGLPPIQSIAAGDLHVVAVAQDGSVWTWGSNSSGQLGDGTLTNRSRAVAVSTSTGLPPAGRAAAGGAHSVVLAENGTVWAWGANGSGQLGLSRGGPSYSLYPQRSRGLANVGEVKAAASRTLAAAGGMLWQWGNDVPDATDTLALNVAGAPVTLNLWGASDSQVVLNWYAATSDWHLQESTDLSQPGWWRDVNLPAAQGVSGYQVRLPLTFGTRFYRLVRGP